MSMGSLYTKLLSEITSPLDTVVHSKTYHLIAVVSVEHTLTCKTGGFKAVRHNEVRDITATLLTEVGHGVTTEPHLQPLSGESLSHCSAITEDRVYSVLVAMYGFWGGKFFIDVAKGIQPIK